MKIPKEMQDKYDEIAPMIIDFCDKKLNDDYKDICLRLLVKLCRKRSSPLLGGRPLTWAAGIVYAIGQVNFIFDKTQKINMTAGELAAGFGISASTAGNKAAEIRKMFKIDYFNSEWLLPELIESNPMNWMIMIDGFITDVRYMSLEIQQQAYEMGLIPYVPGEQDPIEAKASESHREQSQLEQKKRHKQEQPHPDQGELF